MSNFFGFRVYPTPVVKPLFPFALATALVGYYVKKIQDSGSSTPEALKDPKNPWGTFILSAAATAAHQLRRMWWREMCSLRYARDSSTDCLVA